MNERPIWRPNSFTVEEWENLGREEQVQWWKAQNIRSPPAPPSKGIELYLKGAITLIELPGFVFGRLTLQNVEQFLLTCPADVLELLRRQSDRLPAEDDDEGWGTMRTFRSGCYAPWVSEEEIKESQLESDRRFRQGLKVFRSSDRR